MWHNGSLHVKFTKKYQMHANHHNKIEIKCCHAKLPCSLQIVVSVKIGLCLMKIYTKDCAVEGDKAH